jgi:hypothetical protein
MNVIEARQIRTLERQPSLSKVEPDLTLRRVIQSVDPLARSGVQNIEHGGEIRGVCCVFGRMGDEMVMVREDRPRFEAPTVIGSKAEKTPLKNSKPLRAAKMMRVFESARGDKVSARLAELVSRRMWPGRTRLGHNVMCGRIIDMAVFVGEKFLSRNEPHRCYGGQSGVPPKNPATALQNLAEFAECSCGRQRFGVRWRESADDTALGRTEPTETIALQLATRSR